MHLFNKNNDKKASGGGFISQRTRGKTNEISFSVLDAKFEEAENKEAEPWDLQSRANVEEKKKKRKRHRLIVYLSSTCLVLLLGLLVVYFIGGLIQNSSGTNDRLNQIIQLALKESASNDNLSDALKLILEEDVETISSSIDSYTLKSFDKEATDRRNRLEDIKTDLEELVNNIVVPSDKNNLNNALDLVSVEIEMCTLFDDAYSTYLADYITDRQLAVTAMQSIVEGDSADREATTLLLASNSESAKSAKEKIAQAIEANTDARDAFKKMSALREKEFADYISFCQYRIDAQEASYKVAQAYIDRSKEELESQNEIYNTKQNSATEIAKSWQAEPKDLIDREFEATRSKDAENFKAISSRRNSFKKTLQSLTSS